MIQKISECGDHIQGRKISRTFPATNGESSEEPLANLLGALDEASDEIGGHEKHFALLVVFVVASEHRPARGVEGLVEAGLQNDMRRGDINPAMYYSVQ